MPSLFLGFQRTSQLPSEVCATFEDHDKKRVSLQSITVLSASLRWVRDPPGGVAHSLSLGFFTNALWPMPIFSSFSKELTAQDEVI